MESNSIPFISFINSIHDFFSTFSCFCSHPLFSTIVTLYTLILIYAPSFFLRAVLSPLLNSTGIILLFLLKLGANERSRKDQSSEGIRILDSSANERLEKEPNCLEPRVLDHKYKHYEKLSNDGGNLALYSSFGLESTSLEQRSLDMVDHIQTNIKFKAKVELGFGSNQIDVGSKPNSGLDLESNQMNIEIEHDLGPESNSQDDCYKGESLETSLMESSQVVEKGERIMDMNSMQVDTTMKFIEWNMKQPLEIIYEAYEGEEEVVEDSNENNMVSSDPCVLRCERSSSLSMYYPESESASSSDDEFPVNEKWETHESVFFKWEAEEDEREELIEISLDHYGKRSIEFCQDEEDNLIEIDIFSQEIDE
ncbi:hypothetical protein L1987_63268 [Smallanthus sonchifolius]|uniref:Uncharacterized protein n=1 Tax=Smallanthus sonchifolius TaxID=185202 RepID=A0ACB9CCU0_9ASTR|nr:hypothetical protein L1987_63268 [Smallanthus sonchifolius]